MSTLAESETIVKQEPMSHGRTNLRKRKPKRVAVISESCTGCSGSPTCAEYCPVEGCMFWVPDEANPPFGRIATDKRLCIGCARCTSRGPDGTFLDGCPWNAIDMVPTQAWEAEHDVALPDTPGPADELRSVPRAHL